MNLPTIPESTYETHRRVFMSRPTRDALDAVWPDLYALTVASLPAAPVVLPDREAIAKAICNASGGPRWDLTADTDYGWFGSREADAVLGLLAETVSPWQPVEPGTVIKAGTHYRTTYNGGALLAAERVAAKDFAAGEDHSIDPRTVPDPDADLVAVIAAALTDIADDGSGATTDWTPDARDVLALIRETHTIEPKPVTGPLGGAR